MHSPLPTRVELIHVDEHIQHWLRFGRSKAETILDRRRRHLWFEADAVFAFVRWRANAFGTVQSRIDIMRATTVSACCTAIPGVAPGAISLLRLHGWPIVARVLAAIDQVEAIGVDPADACPDHWRHVHNRMSVGAEPRPYTAARHRAWLFRRDDFLC